MRKKQLPLETQKKLSREWEQGKALSILARRHNRTSSSMWSIIKRHSELANKPKAERKKILAGAKPTPGESLLKDHDRKLDQAIRASYGKLTPGASFLLEAALKHATRETKIEMLMHSIGV